MPINNQEILNALQLLSEQQNVRVNVKESLKGGCIAFVCATAGGIMGGPVGLAVGGTIGAVTAGYLGSGKYKSLSEVIQNDMSPQQRNALAESVRSIIEDIRVEDATMLLPILASNARMQQAALNAVASFIQNEMNMRVVQ